MGRTYKIRPNDEENDAAVYVTINDIVIDDQRRPFEIFFNTKNPKYYQTLHSVAVLVSAILRQSGPFPFYVINDLKSIHSLTGGYYLNAQQARICGFTKGIFVSGLVQHVGLLLQQHCKELGIVEDGKSKKT